MNKLFRHILLVLSMITGVGLSGCENYFDLNDNPNLVTNAPLSSLLSTTTHKTAINTQLMGNITSYFVQYLASPTAGGGTDTYQVTDYSSTWDAIYYTLADLQDMKKVAQEQEASEYVGVANILLSYNITLIADTFGSAPYSEAFNGTTLTPGYDSAEELYQTGLTLLDQGIAELSKADSRIRLSAANDLIHGGNVQAWIKTAYALKARMLNKVSKTSSYDPSAVLAAVEKSYTSNADDAQMSTFQLRNPWAQIALNNAALVLGGWLSEQLVDHLNGTTYGIVDPRIEKITDRTINNDYKGTVNGQGNVGGNNTVKDESYISLNSPLTGEASPLILVSYAELKLIEAEAALRAGNRQRAYNAYLEGIRASMNKLGVAAEAREAYLNNPAVAVGAANLTLDLIFKEKYVVTYLNPEAWVDARRYNYQYKGFTLPVNAALPTYIRRIAYPNAETAENGANVPAVASLADPLWWDQ